MSFFVLPPLSFKTPRGGRVTVFGALLTIPLVLGVNEYLDHKKGRERKGKEKTSKERRRSGGGGGGDVGDDAKKKKREERSG